MEMEKPVGSDIEPSVDGLVSDGMGVKPRSRKGLIVAVSIAVLVLLVGGGGAAAYFAGWLPFLNAALEPDEVLDRMYESVPGIMSAYYNVRVRVNTEVRDPGARPIELQVPAVQDKQEQLKADQEKLTDINRLLPAIKRYKNEGGEGVYYPRALLDVVDGEDQERVSELLASGTYLYKQVNEGRSFEFIVTLETNEAAAAYRDAREGRAEATRVIVLAEQSENVFVRLTPSDASLFPVSGLSYEGLYQYIPVEFDLNFSVGGRGRMNSGAESNGEIKVAGSLKMGGSFFEGDVELRKIGDVYYGLVNEFPSIGFFDLAALKEKWVQILPEDDYVRASWDSVSEAGVREDIVISQNEIIFELAQELDVIKVVKEYPKAEEEGENYHYEIEIDADRLPLFYRQVAERSEAELGDEALVKFREATLSYLESGDFKQVYEALRENITMELWVDDESFYPVRIKYSARLVPPDSVVKFQEKQIMASLSVALSSINDVDSVVAPSEYISTEEAQVLVTGVSVEQIKFDKQVQQVRGIQDALKLYKAHAGVFPVTLNDLTKEINSMPSSGNEDESSSTLYRLNGLKEMNKPFIAAVPNDAFTDEPYLYVPAETDFALHYQIVFPAATAPSSYGYDPQEYQRKQYVEGQNTATSTLISVEAAENK